MRPLTASYTDVRRDLKAITDKVMHDRVSVTVFKNNKPAFKIVPLDPVAAPAQGSRQDAVQDRYLDAARAMDDEYRDVFEVLARES